MTAAIALAIAGAKVTVLEAAEQLGEIGAGIQVTSFNSTVMNRICLHSCETFVSVENGLQQITNTKQMTPNVARLLIKWGVADVIGSDLVEVSELNMRRQDGTAVGYTKIIPNIKQDLGYPFVSPFLQYSDFSPFQSYTNRL